MKTFQLPKLLIVILIFVLVRIAVAQAAIDSSNCGSLENHYGPFDYTNPEDRQSKLPKVEQYHFRPEVFRLQAGVTASDPTKDIDYTLRAFPNHHRALDAMARLHRKRNVTKLPEANYSLRCYFQRAQRMSPHDGTVLMIKGIHLFKQRDFESAESAFLEALSLEPSSAEISYNLGLLYVEMGKIELAKRYADQAYQRGYPLPGLRNKLVNAGAWPDDSDDNSSSVPHARH